MLPEEQARADAAQAKANGERVLITASSCDEYTVRYCAELRHAGVRYSVKIQNE